jgi:cyclopropane fatty-acyl-phospholipid synthase-like methyltransferase
MTDPVKQFVLIPETLRLAGSVRNKNLLDIGCGSGLLARVFAGKGANVVGYDHSAEQIRLAKEAANSDKLSFIVAEPETIEEKVHGEAFDKAVSTMVLLYARDKLQLSAFFQSTYNLLKEGGIFSSITFNPQYADFGSARYNRRFLRVKDKIQVDFLDDADKVRITALFSDFSMQDYEDCAREAGFLAPKWVNMKVSQDGMKSKGASFWQDFETGCPYIGLVVRK